MPPPPLADSETEEPGWPGRLHRVGAGLLMASVLGLELWAVLGPYEDWPFTSAPMFARYQTPEDPVFELSFFAEDPSGVSFELEPLQHLGLGELGFRRHFFSRYYGSTDPQHPSWHLPGDAEATFRQRIAAWMKLVVVAYTKQRGHPPRRIWLEASKISSMGDPSRSHRVERRPLFDFVPSTGQLRRLPRAAWTSRDEEAGGT